MVTDSERGQSRPLQFLMLGGLVVMLAAMPTVYFLGFQPSNEPAPAIAGTDVDVMTGDPVTVEASFMSGEAISLSDLELVVIAECQDSEKTARLTELPLADSKTLPAAAVSGDPILAAHSGLTMEHWIAGSAIRLKLDSDHCRLSTGSAATVRVLHRPSNSIIFEASDTR